MKQALRWTASALVVVVLAAASYTAGRALRAHGVMAPSAAWAEQGAVSLVATAKRVIEGGVEKGEVYMGERLLFRVDTTAGGLTGYERAMIIAKRLNDAFAAGAKPEDFKAEVVQGLNAVMWRDKPLITIDNAQAQALGKDRAQVAEEWAAAIRTAMREALGLPPEPPKPPQLNANATATEQEHKPAEGKTEEEKSEKATEEKKEGEVKSAEWTPPEPYDKKIVPIISVGEGIQVGVAQVKGPRSRVKLVQACALLETHYKRTLEIDIYVPISTKKPGKKLARVQGVGVVALGKYKLTGRK